MNTDFSTDEKIFKLLEKYKDLVSEKVIVQTTIPEHRVFACRDDFKKFYDEEMIDRVQLKYPPCCRLLRLELQNRDEDKLRKQVTEVSDVLRTRGVEVLGEEERKIFKIKKKYNMNVWVRINKDENIIKEILKDHQLKIFAL